MTLSAIVFTIAFFCKMRNFLFFCLLWSNILPAQTNDFSESFLYFPQNMSIILPAYGGIGSDVQANFVYRSYLGPLSAIRVYAANVDYNLQKKDKLFPAHAKHSVGGGFYSSREGDFINRNRILFRYVWHIRLTESLHLSGGAAFHVINYVFKASSAGANGSDFAWSGNIGVALYSSSFRFGFAANDFNRPSLTPLDVPSVVYRYYTVHAEKSVELGLQTKLKGSVRANLVPHGYSSLAASLGLLYLDKLGISGFVHNTQGWGLAFELDKLEMGNSWLDLSFAYRFPYSNGYRIPYNSFEINVGYYLLKLRDAE